jgi:hypothetical protein
VCQAKCIELQTATPDNPNTLPMGKTCESTEPLGAAIWGERNALDKEGSAKFAAVISNDDRSLSLGAAENGGERYPGACNSWNAEPLVRWVWGRALDRWSGEARNTSAGECDRLDTKLRRLNERRSRYPSLYALSSDRRGGDNHPEEMGRVEIDSSEHLEAARSANDLRALTL